jgi:hypothetical protein
MFITKTISTLLDKLKRREIKVLRFGKSDIQTPIEVGPYGIDSNPIKDMIAIYSETSERGKAVIVGYMNKNQLAQPGEFRAYSTDNNGGLKTYIWLKNNGNMEIGGDTNFLVRYNQLNQELQNFALFMNEQFALIATGISAGGGSYTPGNAQIDISEAKTEKIKTE